MKNDEKKITEFINLGSEIAGRSVGSTVGFLLGGVGGAAIGGGVGAVISSVGKKAIIDFSKRYLSVREQTRISATAALAIDKMKTFLEEGKRVRDDGFFDSHNGNRPDAEEVFEGILLKGKNEHEEKKLLVIANLLANIFFIEGVSVREANYYLRLAETLTYAKMCCLKIAFMNAGDGIGLRQGRYFTYSDGQQVLFGEKDMQLSPETISIIQELYELHNQGLVDCLYFEDKSIGDLAASEMAEVANNRYRVSPNMLKLTQLGERSFEILGLDVIPSDDLKQIIEILKK